MSKQWAPEPWEYLIDDEEIVMYDRLVDANGKSVTYGFVLDAITRPTADRIIACVNALEGVPTETLLRANNLRKQLDIIKATSDKYDNITYYGILNPYDTTAPWYTVCLKVKGKFAMTLIELPVDDLESFSNEETETVITQMVKDAIDGIAEYEKEPDDES